MNADVIQRQYDEVISTRYDDDPQDITSQSLECALEQLQRLQLLGRHDKPLDVLDIGMGTGLFYRKLRRSSERSIRPHGLDLSSRMIRIAREMIPDLVAEVDDAANLASHFINRKFGLVCTHFITGFVPLDTLAPEIIKRLHPGGIWSFVGGTAESYPGLQAVARKRMIRWVMGGGELNLGGLLCPRNEKEVVEKMHQHGLEVLHSETYSPQLSFSDFDEFMAFAYHGGWLTPFIEELGLHRSRPAIRALLNALVFPFKDQHRVVVATVRNPAPEAGSRN